MEKSTRYRRKIWQIGNVPVVLDVKGVTVVVMDVLVAATPVLELVGQPVQEPVMEAVKDVLVAIPHVPDVIHNARDVVPLVVRPVWADAQEQYLSKEHL